jgi:hypothetical protein
MQARQPTVMWLLVLVAVLAIASVQSFQLPISSSMIPKNIHVHHRFSSVSSVSSTALSFGLPSWFTTPENAPVDNDSDSKGNSNKSQQAATDSVVPEKKIGWSGVVQLITAGMGAPFLGDFEGVDQETGKFMFSLEANNLVDEDGNSKQTKMPYFENGWVDPEDEKRAKEGFKLPWQK